MNREDQALQDHAQHLVGQWHDCRQGMAMALIVKTAVQNGLGVQSTRHPELIEDRRCSGSVPDDRIPLADP
jgi:hypothetical protein